jgi:hypothetical protein
MGLSFRDVEFLTVIPARCDSIKPSGVQLRTENLGIPGSALTGCPGMTMVTQHD